MIRRIIFHDTAGKRYKVRAECHIPFSEVDLPKSWRGFILRYLKNYDAVIVSSKRYLEGLRNLGYDGPAYRVCPYIDPASYPLPTSEEMHALREQLGLHEEDKVILTVARLDPMKAQDRVIYAFKRVLTSFPNARLVLVGNGSFSSSKSGIGLPKAERWVEYLKKCVRELGLNGNVIFAGYLREKDLRAAYAISEVFVLPSIREGFGLVVVEGWLYRKPAIVSNYAGVADLIDDGRNGLTFDPNDTRELASKIISVLKNQSELASRLGEEGLRTSQLCHIDVGIKAESEILGKYIGGITHAVI